MHRRRIYLEDKAKVIASDSNPSGLLTVFIFEDIDSTFKFEEIFACVDDFFRPSKKASRADFSPTTGFPSLKNVFLSDKRS